MLTQDKETYILTGDGYRMVWSKRNGTWRDVIAIKIGARWQTISQTLWHVQMVTNAKSPRSYWFDRLDVAASDNDHVLLDGCVVTDIGRLTVRYVVCRKGLITADLRFVVSPDHLPPTGLKFLGQARPDGYDRVRFYDFIPSGWSNAQGGIVFSSHFSCDARNHRATLAYFDQCDETVQAMGLRFPPCRRSYHSFTGETRIEGRLSMYVHPQDLFGSEVKVGSDESYNPPATLMPPRYSHRTYIEHWSHFAQRPELWVDLGDEMGLFHRGFYNILAGREKMKYSGVLRFDKLHDGSLDCHTENDRLVELAWGGSANVVLAETMVHMGRRGLMPDGEDRAGKIINAILHFRDGGFHVKDGPCRGAWWNGYIVEKDHFASRYGRSHVETPNQGIINYFLYRLIRLGVTVDPLVTERIVHNCTTYLKSIEQPRGGVLFGQYTDGRIGEDRHYVKYETCFASGCAMAALSWLCAGRLTGEAKFRKKAKALFDHVVKDHIQKNEWRFLEYDTTGTDAKGQSWILIALCEALKDFDEPTWRQAADRTFRLLWSLIFHDEPDLDRYFAKEACWGGSMRIKGGVVHGSSAGSDQGAHAVHIRYDLPLALKLYCDLSGDPRAYCALVGYLNFMTWHQFLRPELPIGYGATTESCSLDDRHFQDTAQIKHSNPLVMLDLLDDLQLTGSTAEVMDISRPETGKLRLRLRSLDDPLCRLSFNRPVAIHQDGRLLWQGDGSSVALDVPAETTVNVCVLGEGS